MEWRDDETDRSGEWDEGPSNSDIEAFDREDSDDAADAYCPNCGRAVWHEAQHCAGCGEYFASPAYRPPGIGQSRSRLFGAIMLGVIGLIVLFYVLAVGF